MCDRARRPATRSSRSRIVLAGMRIVLRIAVVLVSAVAYTATFVIALSVVEVLSVDVDLSRPTATSELSGALARGSEALGDPEDPAVVQVCGFPPKRQVFHLSHADTLALARCLHEQGYLSAAGLALIQNESFVAINGQRIPDTDAGGVVTRGVFWSYVVGGEVIPRPWWESALWVVAWLSGLVVIVWLVGFRLPAWRLLRRTRPRPPGPTPPT